MKISDFFEESFFINLDCRPKRKEAFINEMERVNLKNFVTRFPAVVNATDLPRDDYNRHRACGKSHWSILKHAQEKNLRNVLIFEDDAYFYDGGKKPGIEIIESALDTLSTIDYWDVFYLGGLIIDPEIDLVSNHLAKVNTVLTAHAWAVNNCGLEKILRYIPETDSAIDGWVGQRHEIIKYIAYPLAVPQREGISDLDANGKNPGIGPYFHSYSKPIKTKNNPQISNLIEHVRTSVSEYLYYKIIYAFNDRTDISKVEEFLQIIKEHVTEEEYTRITDKINK